MAENVDTSKIVTGQMHVRHQGDAPTRDGRKLIMVCALLAVPETAEFQDERMYTLTGTADGRMLSVSARGELPAERTRGMGPAGIFTAPIWRV